MKFTISKKIGLGFTIVILFVVFNGFYSIYTFNTIRVLQKHNTEVVEPFRNNLSELNLLLTRLRMQVINWVYFPNSDEKIKLEGIQMIEYPVLVEELEGVSKKYQHHKHEKTLQLITSKIESLFEISSLITENLNTVDDYNDPMIFFTSSSSLADEFDPAATKILIQVEKLQSQIQKDSDQSKQKILDAFKQLERVLLISFIILLIATILSLYFTTKSITGPVSKLKAMLTKIAKGELPEPVEVKSTDEIHDMNLEMNKVVTGLNNNTEFARKIGQGEFDLPYKKLSDDDVLGEALIEMKKNLKSTSDFAKSIENADYSVEYHLKGESDQLGKALISMKQGIVEAKEALEAKNKIVIEKNKNITDSINYAKNIQQSIVPDITIFKNLFTDPLMFYKTKDLVSGDIPWAYAKGDFAYCAAIDCTGHGVPGALLSIVAHFTLSNIISTDLILSPADILNQLHSGVVEALNQSEDSSVNDGMDVGMIRYNSKTNELVFASAGRPLYIISKTGELTEIKGQKRAVGGVQYDLEPFVDITVPINKEDTVYVFSDGIVDQFGGPNFKKFMSARLRTLLTENNRKSMSEIEELISSAFFDWKGTNSQTDDVIIIGLRI